MTMELKFDQPTAVFLSGTNRALLNWTAFALAASTDPEFHWTDVRLRGEVLEPDDPLGRGRVPEHQLSVVRADELTRNEGDARIAAAATGALLRSDEPPEAIRRLVSFLRLPSHTQEVLSRARRDGPAVGLVLSNAHRTVALYPTDSVGPIVRAIVDAGAILFLTWGDAAPEGRREFDSILRIDGGPPREWRSATITVEKGPEIGPFRSGSKHRLEDVQPIARLLGTEFP